jgi:hypothetical protein
MELNLEIIVSALIGLAMSIPVVARVIAKGKGKVKAFVKVGKEAVELAQVSVEAFDDNTLTAEETAQIKKEANDVKMAWNVLVTKEEDAVA